MQWDRFISPSITAAKSMKARIDFNVPHLMQMGSSFPGHDQAAGQNIGNSNIKLKR